MCIIALFSLLLSSWSACMVVWYTYIWYIKQKAAEMQKEWICQWLPILRLPLYSRQECFSEQKKKKEWIFYLNVFVFIRWLVDSNELISFFNFRYSLDLNLVSRYRADLRKEELNAASPFSIRSSSGSRSGSNPWILPNPNPFCSSWLRFDG